MALSVEPSDRFKEPDALVPAKVEAGALASQVPVVMQFALAANMTGAIPKARDFKAISRQVADEAGFLGAAVQYSIPYRTKICPACEHEHKSKPSLYAPCEACGNPMVSLVKGPSRKTADLIARYMQIAVHQEIVAENSKQWTVRISAVDPVTMMPRIADTIIMKPKGDYTPDQRTVDMVFNAGTSKARRNMLLQMVPSHLVDLAIESGLDQRLHEVHQLGVVKFMRRLMKSCDSIFVKWERALAAVGCDAKFEFKDADDQAAEYLAEIKARYMSVKDGDVTADEAFPKIGGEEAESATTGTAESSTPDDGSYPIDFHKNRGNFATYKTLVSEHGVEGVHKYLDAFPVPYKDMSPGEQTSALKKAASALSTPEPEPGSNG